jgi:hypothetical protein
VGRGPAGGLGEQGIRVGPSSGLGYSQGVSVGAAGEDRAAPPASGVARPRGRAAAATFPSASLSRARRPGRRVPGGVAGGGNRGDPLPTARGADSRLGFLQQGDLTRCQLCVTALSLGSLACVPLGKLCKHCCHLLPTSFLCKMEVQCLPAGLWCKTRE